MGVMGKTIRLYPKCKFAKTYSLDQQLLHIKSEVREVSEAMYELIEDRINKLRLADQSPDPQLVENLLMELHDLAASAQTMMDIAVREFGDTVADINGARIKVIAKNRERGYYE